MSTSRAELLADQASTGIEVELICSDCGECWTVFVPHGEDVSTRQARCPVCPDGEGTER